MAVYTCYDMIRDCRAGLAEGWTHFVREYLPVSGEYMQHYASDRAGDPELLGHVLLTLHQPDSDLFHSHGPAPEREFVTVLREFTLAALGMPPRDGEPLAPGASGSLSAIECQITWLAGMKYDQRGIARLMNVAEATAEATLQKARATFGEKPLDRAALPPQSNKCHTCRVFLDYLDGRLTWARRHDIDAHLCICWRCVDLLCCVREGDLLLQRTKPLTADEAEPYLKLIGIEAAKPSLWKRMFA